MSTAPPISPQARRVGRTFDPLKVRADFPILNGSAGRPLVYLDNGATTQKPQAVIDALARYYESQNANIHRGVYRLSQIATEAYESARQTVARFINATEPQEIIFTRGTTEAINLVASSWGRANLREGDDVVISALEHHSNIVPWQMACAASGAKLRVIPINDAGELRLDEYEHLLSPRTRMVALTHLSNALGTINDVQRIASMAHRVGAKVLVDGAQWVAHHPTDVKAIDADFYCFSGHKLLGPTGIGCLYGKRELLAVMPPYQGGGDMIESVTFEKTVYAGLPNRFEAGTPNIAGAIGLAAAIDYLSQYEWRDLIAHENDLLQHGTQRLAEVKGLRIVGTAKNKGSLISFVLEDPAIATLDVGSRLDLRNIAVRTGHHCCQPVMDRFGIPATARASFALYNTRADIDALVEGLHEIVAEAQTARSSAYGAGRTSPAPANTSGSTPAAHAIAYPAPSAPTVAAAAEQLVEVFEFLGDRDSRNQFLLDDLAPKLPPMDPALKTPRTRVHGCMSVVHLYGAKRSGTEDTIDFVADSDAQIVRGLIGLLQRLFSGQRAGEILSFDMVGFFDRIGLAQFITVQRRSGVEGMINKIRAIAESARG